MKTVLLASVAAGLVFLLIWKLSFLQCYSEETGRSSHNDRHANLAQK